MWGVVVFAVVLSALVFAVSLKKHYLSQQSIQPSFSCKLIKIFLINNRREAETRIFQI